MKGQKQETKSNQDKNVVYFGHSVDSSRPDSLILKGRMHTEEFSWLVDSGATHNFVDEGFVHNQGLQVNTGRTVNVKMADGNRVQTKRFVKIFVDFGDGNGSMMNFTVLPHCPLVLGMPFLRQFNPVIDWQHCTLAFRGTSCLHVDRLCVDNPFLELAGQTDTLSKAPANNHIDQSTVRAEPMCEVAGEYQGRAEVDCTTLDKIGQTRDPQCIKNVRVKQTKSTKQVEGNVSAKVPQRSRLIEQCALKTFCTGLKRGQYEEVFLCSLQNKGEQQNLNFTHRTSHGTSGEGDKQVADQLAGQVLEQLKVRFPSVFQEPTFPIKRDDPDFYHYIDLKDSSSDPPRKKLYPLDQVELEALKQQIQDLLESGRIVHSHSPYGAPILFAKKKGTNKLRMCIDYRSLNKNTILDRYPLPRIDELFGRVRNCSVFSKLDLSDGYHQIPMFKQDCYKTAFCTRYGQFEFTVMPFGLCNAPATFQRVMNKILFDLLDKCVLVYLDDILIYSPNIEQHIDDLNKVFAILDKNQLKLKQSKCLLFLESVEFLGHKISAKGIEVEQGKVEAVENWPIPNSVNEVQQFLGLCNYYRRFVKNFAKFATPLTTLTKKDIKFGWDTSQQSAFDALKKFLVSAPCLSVFYEGRKTRVVCDASQTAVGAVLEQLGSDDQWHPVEFFSKKLNDAQCNYSATEREMLAVIMSLERWRQYLVGIEFEVFTDHASLVYLLEQSKLSRRQARWLDFLGQFKFSFVHIAGKANVVADGLSRMPDQHLRVTNVISLGDESYLLDIVKRCQEAASDDKWFQDVKTMCKPDSKVYSIRNNIVCRLIEDYFAPVIPPSQTDLIRLILLEFHASSLGGHLSATKMYQLCNKRFYWPKMRQSVDKFCKECTICQQSRTSTQKPYGLLAPNLVPNKPFEIVSMDFITQLPCTNDGNDCLFVVVDRFSKFTLILPCKTSISAPEVAQLFFDNFICTYGTPQKIISDRDPRFTSLFWKGLFKALDCKLNLSTAFHPQTDGQTERYNRSLEQVLRCYISPTQDDWDTLCPQVQFALNSTVHQGTSTSAFECIYGFAPKLPIDTALSMLYDNKVQSVEDFFQKRLQVQKRVKLALDRYNSSMKSQVDKKRRDITYSLDDMVYLSTQNLALPSGLSRKFAAKFLGPYKVVEQVSPVSYKLALPPELGKLHPVFHVSLLKPAFGDLQAPRAPVFSVDSDTFEVDRILAKRFSHGSVEYLVMWKGYNLWDATWEPLANLTDCQILIDQFDNSTIRTRRQRA